MLDFHALFDASPNPYMALDRELRFVTANQAYLRLTGRTLAELAGRHLFDAFPNDPADANNHSAAMLRDSLNRVLATGETDVLALIPYRIDAGDGLTADRYWSATHTPVLDAHGAVAFILQHTVDVTALHEQTRRAAAEPAAWQTQAGVLTRARLVQEANSALDAERRHLRSLFEQAPGFMVFLGGPEHVFELANHAYYALVGHRDILGKPVLDALPEVRSQGFANLLDQVYSSGEPYVGRGVRVLLQRAEVGPPDETFVDFVYQPIRDAAGAVNGIFVQGNDITAQQRLAAELQALLEREQLARATAEAAEQRQRFLAESIPQQVWTADRDGHLDFVNQRTTEYFGASAVEVVGGGWQRYVHPEDLPECLNTWAGNLASGAEYQAEFRLRRADGSYRWHLARASALRDGDGHIVSWFGTNTDMDELKRARDILQERSEFDRQLLAIVSHDLRNPINAITVATALLVQRGQLDEQQGRVVGRIMSSAERATRLVRDFLDFTQARVSGEIPVSRRPVNLRGLARHAFDEVHLTYADRHATYVHEGEETGVWDGDRIAQLIGNLVGNAFQHSPSDSTVHVVTRGRDDEAVIEVRNAGVAIPPDQVARLFEPYQRGTSTGSAQRSIGLGLYISRQIVTAHAGTIDVRSTDEGETVFTVRLPRHTTASGAAADADRTMSDQGPTRSRASVAVTRP